MRAHGKSNPLRSKLFLTSSQPIRVEIYLLRDIILWKLSVVYIVCACARVCI